MERDRVHEFMEACFEWLEGGGPEVARIPSVEGMTPEEVARARRWLTWLAESRRNWEMVAQVADRLGRPPPWEE